MKLKLIATILTFLFLIPAFAQSKMEFNFNVGGTLTENGNISDLGESGLNTGFGFNYYLKPNHGVGFSVSNAYDIDGTTKFSLLEDGNISVVDIHYTYRYIRNKFHFIIEPGFGWQTIYDETEDIYGYSYYNDLSTALALNYKLFARYILNEWGDDNNFFAGAGIIHQFSMDDKLNGRDISGNRLSLLFQFGFGF